MFPFHSRCVCNTTVRGGSQGYSRLKRLKCAVRHAGKVICRRTHEKTPTHIHIDHSFGCFCIRGQVLYFTYTTCSPLILPGSDGIVTEVGSAFD